MTRYLDTIKIKIMKKIIYNSESKCFSLVKVFSDWDQIRDLVNDQLPKGVTKITKIRGSDDGKSYQVVMIYRGGKTSKPVTIPINGKSALDNYNKATNSKIENTSSNRNKLIKDISDSKNDDENIRRKLAKSNTTSKKLLIDLSNDSSQWVRYEVAKNPNTPKEILEKLSNDSNDFVISGLLRNPNLSEDILRKLSKTESSMMLEHIAEHPNTPKDILRELRKNKYDYVRDAAIRNLHRS